MNFTVISYPLLFSSLGIAQDDADGNSCNGELPAIVVYMIDPFQISGVSDAKQTLWSFYGLLRAFSEMTASFSELLRSNVFLQVGPQLPIFMVEELKFLEVSFRN